MASDGLLDDLEFQKAIENADPLTRALASESRQTRKDISGIAETINQLPCNQCQNCQSDKTVKQPSRPLLYSGAAGGIITIGTAIAYLVKDVIIPLFKG